MSRTARTEIASSELLAQLFVPVHHADALLHARFRWETLPALAGDFECWFILKFIWLGHTTSYFCYCEFYGMRRVKNAMGKV